MSTIHENLCAIERRAKHAIVEELRRMAQEILVIRTQLSLADRAHADALLLTVSQLECCVPLDSVAPSAMAAAALFARRELPEAAFDTLEPAPPSHYLVHFYSHDAGDLERVELAESVAGAAQRVRQHLAERPRPVWQVTHDAARNELAFLSYDDMLLASIVPCEPHTPRVDPRIAEACAALADGDVAGLRDLFIASTPARSTPLAA